MQEQNQTEQEVSSVTTTETAEMSQTAPVKTAGGGAFKRYLVVGIVVALIALALIFVLEREGRLSTGLFSGVISALEVTSPVAVVNGQEISRRDFDSSYNQLLQMAATQGTDVTDPAVTEQYQTQAIDTLVNGELLRQAAIAAGMTASDEAINTRYGEIETGVGGPEALLARMTEIGVNETTLRRDIENEILIQGLFDQTLTSTSQEVTEEEVTNLYEQLGGEEAGLPPLADVYDQVVEQIKLDRQQAEVSVYLEQLRTEATIEVLI